MIGPNERNSKKLPQKRVNDELLKEKYHICIVVTALTFCNFWMDYVLS